MSIDIERRTYPLIIGNEAVEAMSGKRFQSVNPATGETIAEVAFGGADDVDAAVQAARASFDSAWARVSGQKRNRLMMGLADRLLENLDALVTLEARDIGKPVSSVRAEIYQGISELEFFAGASTKLDGGTHGTPHGFLNYTLREPIGVCGLIVPWNYPLMLTLRKLAPALAAGNTVVIKPAEESPLSAVALAELAIEAGFPAGTINVVTGDGPTTGASLAEHPDVDKISFTGSTEVGRLILGAARTDFRRVSLELGGKSPAIIFDDADLDSAIPSSVWSIYYSAGQSCDARSRIFVQRSVYDAFVERFVALARTLRVGDPLDPSTHVGALISPEHLERVAGYIESGKAEGAEVALGGGRAAVDGHPGGNFLQPTALIGCSNDMRVAQEEIFGPVATVIPFDDESEVVAAANDSVYGLTSTIWTRDVGRAHRVAGRIKSGVVTINQPFTVFPGTPFGGYKQSGWGREVSLDALDEFTEQKSVLVYTGDRPIDPFRLG